MSNGAVRCRGRLHAPMRSPAAYDWDVRREDKRRRAGANHHTIGPSTPPAGGLHYQIERSLVSTRMDFTRLAKKGPATFLLSVRLLARAQSNPRSSRGPAEKRARPLHYQ